MQGHILHGESSKQKKKIINEVLMLRVPPNTTSDDERDSPHQISCSAPMPVVLSQVHWSICKFRIF